MARGIDRLATREMVNPSSGMMVYCKPAPSNTSFGSRITSAKSCRARTEESMPKHQDTKEKFGRCPQLHNLRLTCHVRWNPAGHELKSPSPPPGPVCLCVCVCVGGRPGGTITWKVREVPMASMVRAKAAVVYSARNHARAGGYSSPSPDANPT